MKPVNVRFEGDPGSDTIDVLIRASEETPEIAELMQKIHDHFEERLTVYDESGAVQSICVTDIVSASVDGKRVSIRTENGRYHIKHPLQALENMLDDQFFVRISRYEIVNMRKVVRYDFRLIGTLYIELSDGTTTWASRRNIPLIRKMLFKKEESPC